jgi:hypothetical protein
MSAIGPKRTFRIHYLVGAGEQCRRDVEAPSCGAAAEIAHDDGWRVRQEH